MKIGIIKNIKLWLGISVVLVLASLVFFVNPGLNKGIDFTGGNLFQLKFEKEVNGEQVKEILKKLDSKYATSVIQVSKAKEEVKAEVKSENTTKAAIASPIKVVEKDVVLIRTQELTEIEKTLILEKLKAEISKFEILRIEKVGSVIGKELKSTAITALLIGSLLIVGYITLRFELKYALAAIVALLHDVIIAIGVIALLGYEINTPFIAAMLTILGYSINDTIVVFDRIRESAKKMKDANYGEIIDESINQVMVRSINTSVTTLLAIIAILLFGGASLKTFITTLLVGILSGTYSSIFVASPVVYILDKYMKKTVTEKEVAKEV